MHQGSSQLEGWGKRLAARWRRPESCSPGREYASCPSHCVTGTPTPPPHTHQNGTGRWRFRCSFQGQGFQKGEDTQDWGNPQSRASREYPEGREYPEMEGSGPLLLPFNFMSSARPAPHHKVTMWPWPPRSFPGGGLVQEGKNAMRGGGGGVANNGRRRERQGAASSAPQPLAGAGQSCACSLRVPV